MFRKGHRFLAGHGLLTLALWAVPGVLACGSFGTSTPPPEGAPVTTDAAPPDAAAPPVDAADAQPDPPPVPPPVKSFVGTVTATTLPGARAYTRAADGRTFALLDRGPSDSVAVVEALGLPGKRWRSEAPGVSLAMLTTTSCESEVQDGLAAVIIEDNSTRRMRIGSGHEERGLKGIVVATAGAFVFVGSDADITQAEVDGRLDVVDKSPRVVLSAGERAPFAVATSGRMLLRRDPGVDAVLLHTRTDLQSKFGPATRSTFTPSVEQLQLVAVGPNGDTFTAAGRCVAGLPANCLWTFTQR